MDLRQRLAVELARRRTGNRRYSLRAFARDLGTDHASLSQFLRGRRHLSPRQLQRLGHRLHLAAADIAEACEQHYADTIVRLAGLKAFQPDSRWIATRTGVPLDAVNAALTRLLRQRRLVMRATGRWHFSSHV